MTLRHRFLLGRSTMSVFLRVVFCLAAIVLPTIESDIGLARSELGMLQPAAGVTVAVFLNKIYDPDDMTLDGRGDLLISSLSAGLVLRVDLRQRQRVVQPIITGLAGPEGLVVLPSGDLVVAEQKANRLTMIGPHGQKHVLRMFPNTTGKDGIDGLGWDSRRAELFIPDSPHGVVLAMPLHAGKAGKVVQLAGNYVRPVDALARQDGAVIVADEYGNALWQIAANRHTLTRLTEDVVTPDDLAIDKQGTIYVTCLGDGTLKALDPAGHLSTLVSGLHDPQGLVIAHQDTRSVQLFVSEETLNRIVSVTIALPA